MNEILHTLRAYPDILQAIGLVGFMLYVGAFSAIQSGRLCGNGILFSTNQVVAASCVLISLLGAFNLASFLIQVSYIGIGIYGIAIRRRHARTNRSRPLTFRRTVGAALPPTV